MKKYNTAETLFLLIAVLIAFLQRYSFYLSNYYITASGIASGSDFQFFLEDPISFAARLKLEFFHCGNTALLIPLLGVIYRYFGVYPGVHYFAVIMIFVSSIICVFPYFICRRFYGGKFSYGGVIGTFLMMLNPILIKESPVVSSDTIGVFVLALVFFFLFRAIYSYKLSEDYLLVGFFLALLPFTRTVFIPLGFVGIIVFAAVIILKDIVPIKKGSGPKHRKMWGMILKLAISVSIFMVVLVGYDSFIRRNSGRHMSYIGYFMHDCFGLTSIGRNLNAFEWVDLAKRFKTFFAHAGGLGNILWEDLFSNVRLHSFMTKGILLGVVFMLWRNFYLVFPIIVIGAVYFASVAAYFINFDERYLMPFVLMFAVASGFIFSEIAHVFSRFKKLNRLGFVIRALFVILIISSFAGSINLLFLAEDKYNDDVEYLKWVDRSIPANAVVLTSENVNPWLICEFAKRPVIYKAVNYCTIFINKVPYLYRDYKPLSKLYDNIEGEAIWYKLFMDGYVFVIIESEFCEKLRDNLLNYNNSAIRKPYFKDPVKIADYNKDPGRAVYLLDLDENYYSNARI